MTDAADAIGAGQRDPAANRPALDNRRLRRRYAAERRFKAYGVVAVAVALIALVWLLFSIVGQGYQAFVHTYVKLDVSFDAQRLDPSGGNTTETLARANYGALYKTALRGRFGDVKKRRDRRALYALLSQGAEDDLRDMVMSDPSIIGTRKAVWLTASDHVDMLVKGKIDRDGPERVRPIKDKQLAWIDALTADGRVETKFNTRFFSAGASREPELAGIWGAIMGSFFTMMVTLLLSFPVGVGAAVFLEEFAPKNRWTDLIEVNINNLAAVPSIVFGLLGLAVILNFFGVPRSAPLAGGMVLALMTLPTVVIATRAALKAVPPSIREAALGIGASKLQVITHHVLPLALPGILTGTIIGMAQALGETAPLLMIGMVAFIVDIPTDPLSPATVLPVQIYLWSDMPERSFVEKTSAAIMVLLGFLVIMNAVAIYLRRKFERRW